MYCGAITVLSGINAQLVNAGGRLREDVDSVTGVCHVVEKVDRKRREGEHQQPDHNQEIRDHDELWKKLMHFSLNEEFTQNKMCAYSRDGFHHV